MTDGSSLQDWRKNRQESAANGTNPTILGTLASGWVAFGDSQFLPGYCVLISNNLASRAFEDLSYDERISFLYDMDCVGQSVKAACLTTGNGFTRINYEIQGNLDQFPHAHIRARYSWEEPAFAIGPVTQYKTEHFNNPSTNCLNDKYLSLRASITDHLETSCATFKRA